MGGTYLEVLGCLKVALRILLDGEMDAFDMGLGTGLTFVLVNLNGMGAGGGGAVALRKLIDSNRSFPVMSTFSITLAALETLPHVLDFKSSVLFWVWVANRWLGDLYTIFDTNLVSCSAVKVNVSFVVLDCGRLFWLTIEAYVFGY